jgi:hypothetical protein
MSSPVNSTATTRLSPGGNAGRRLPIIGLLLLGGIVLPLIGWIIGVTLLWRSTAWRVTDKLIGTFILPGGLMAAVAALGFSSGSGTCSGSGGPGISVQTSCSGGGGADIPSLLIVAVLAIAPILSAFWLYIRAN